jgi:hypothetical protein
MKKYPTNVTGASPTLASLAGCRALAQSFPGARVFKGRALSLRNADVKQDIELRGAKPWNGASVRQTGLEGRSGFRAAFPSGVIRAADAAPGALRTGRFTAGSN